MSPRHTYSIPDSSRTGKKTAGQHLDLMLRFGNTFIIFNDSKPVGSISKTKNKIILTSVSKEVLIWYWSTRMTFQILIPNEWRTKIVKVILNEFSTIYYKYNS